MIVTKSEKSYNLQLEAVKGSYYLTITSSKDAMILLLFTSLKFTPLLPGSSNLLSNPGNFELPSDLKPVLIEIYNCKGEVTVIGSQNYSNIISGKGDKTNMQHYNFGGHEIFNFNPFIG